MRKIEEQMIAAIKENRNWDGGNTKVQIGEGGSLEVRLFGNLIAFRDHSYRWHFTLAGYNTVTTRSRINTLLTAFVPTHYVYTTAGTARLHHRKSHTARALDDLEMFTLT